MFKPFEPFVFESIKPFIPLEISPIKPLSSFELSAPIETSPITRPSFLAPSERLVLKPVEPLAPRLLPIQREMEPQPRPMPEIITRTIHNYNKPDITITFPAPGRENFTPTPFIITSPMAPFIPSSTSNF